MENQKLQPTEATNKCYSDTIEPGENNVILGWRITN